MIHAVYSRSLNRLTVMGHAYSGETGHDLVCAAVSAVVYSLAINVDCMRASEHLDDSVVELSSGKADISVKPKSLFKGAVTLIFDAVCLGLYGLAHTYPDKITYDVVE